MKKVLIYYLFVTKEILTYAAVECVIHIFFFRNFVLERIYTRKMMLYSTNINQKQLHL